MNYAQRKLREIEESGTNMTRLASMAGKHPALFYRIKDGKRPCPPVLAATLEIITEGDFSFRKANPDLAGLLDKIGFKQGNQEDDPPNDANSNPIENKDDNQRMSRI